MFVTYRQMDIHSEKFTQTTQRLVKNFDNLCLYYSLSKYDWYKSHHSEINTFINNENTWQKNEKVGGFALIGATLDKYKMYGIQQPNPTFNCCNERGTCKLHNNVLPNYRKPIPTIVISELSPIGQYSREKNN